jgi:5-methylcytosine-specific restriction endonuclease McrA
MKKYICKYSGCSEIIDSNGYCSNHVNSVPKREYKVKPFENARRYNQDLYKTSRWKELRSLVISEQKRCQYCGSIINLEVHHIIRPKGNEQLFYDKSNLLVVCKRCHQSITANETHRGV